jgi:CBS domain containing-hemolysin-like protein
VGVSLFLELVGVAALVLLNAFFVAAEYGLVTSRRTRILELEHQGSRRARTALNIVQNPPRFIAAMQLGVTLTSLAIGAIGEPVLARVLDPILAGVVAFALAFLVITFLHVVIGELVPKGVALGHPERVALAVSTPVRGFFVIARPLIWVLQRSTELVLRVLGQSPVTAEGEAHSEAELRMLLTRSSEQGEIEQGEREMLDKVFDFADKDASDVMRTRPEVVALSVALPMGDALHAVIDSPYTRYPVYRESLDDIIGVLHVRDLFKALYNEGIENVAIDSIVRPAYIVPETKELDELLAEFRRTNQHMAIVVDEYGAMQGIVTLEDLLEEIVGEIADEHDVPDEPVEELGGGRVGVTGTYSIDEFNERFSAGLPSEDYHTVAGFVFGQLGRAAEPGDAVVWDGLRFNVTDVEGQRIERLEVELATAEAGSAEPVGDA